ncbi:hypothetical protein [Leptolyngbya sp. 'hensonii']|uniref:hypothetical protein n=1 Tax=Leptolyngbya sp. 'hensonii' TaxID=1922337 RepID=UPI00117C881C|nr:hypothetical protein [Leptolyngbya sp. 'hensonii']
MEPFIKVTVRDLTVLNSLNLRYSEYRLFWYCKVLDPFCNRWAPFSVPEALKVCNFQSVGTVYMGLKTLKTKKLVNVVWENGRVSVENFFSGRSVDHCSDPTITTVIEDHCSDPTITTVIEPPPETARGADFEPSKIKNLKDIRKSDLKSFPQAGFPQAPKPGTSEYWKWIGGQQ